jgi:hypothetical protein
MVACIPIIFFTGKFAAHNYYSILVTPAVALFGALTITRVLRFNNPVSAQTISLAGAWLLIVLGYVNYIIVEGGQLLLGTSEERQKFGGALAANMGLLASAISVIVLILCFYSIRRKIIVERSWNSQNITFQNLAILLALFILYFPIRIISDSPRFGLEKNLIINYGGSEAQKLLALDCWPPPILHFETNLRGLMISDVAISSARVSDSMPASSLRSFDLVVSCSSILSQELNSYLSRGISPNFVGYSYGGGFQVVGGENVSLELRAEGLWSVS